MNICTNLYYVGVNDRTKTKFEGLWPLPLGVSYNAYLIADEKVALIDTVDRCYGDRFLEHIRLALGDRPIDYLVINHMEPDHSASIRFIRRYYPQIEIVGNSKTLGMIRGFYGEMESMREICDGALLSLGKTNLRFYLTPMVHWPETMMTWWESGQVLFSGDAFGCFGALNGGILDRKIDTTPYWEEMIRYYANIVGKYGSPVQKAFEKLAPLPIRLVCPTHGPVWEEELPKTRALYDRMSRYETAPGVVIAYGSMYGHTEQMAETIAEGLSEAGVRDIALHNLSYSHASYVLRDIFKYKGLIVGGPTYQNGLFPEVEALLAKIESRDIRNHLLGYFGSFTWAGASVKRIAAFAEKCNWETVGTPVEMKQAGTAATKEQCVALARAMAERLCAAG